MSYQYWESFLNDWKNGTTGIGTWTDPDLLPLYNDANMKDLSSLYIPEPWWGNDGTKELHSVVINYNPGKAQYFQRRGTIVFNSYSNDVVNNTMILPGTRCWHWSKRAIPVLSSLARLGIISPSYSLENHLSVELIPWHTDKVGSGFRQYVDNNVQAIYDNSICFAAEESRRIANEKLKSKVILRMNDKTTIDFLTKLKNVGQNYSCQATRTSLFGNGKYMIFTIASLPDITFISIWGPNSRNDFPPKQDMDDIISKI